MASEHLADVATCAGTTSATAWWTGSFYFPGSYSHFAGGCFYFPGSHSHFAGGRFHFHSRRFDLWGRHFESDLCSRRFDQDTLVRHFDQPPTESVILMLWPTTPHALTVGGHIDSLDALKIRWALPRYFWLREKGTSTDPVLPMAWSPWADWRGNLLVVGLLLFHLYFEVWNFTNQIILAFSNYYSMCRGRISLVMGHCNSCLGKVWVNEGATAIPVTGEGHQGKFKNSKGASRQTMQLLSFDKLHLLKVKGWERRCRFGVPPPLGTVLNCFH